MAQNWKEWRNGKPTRGKGGRKMCRKRVELKLIPLVRPRRRSKALRSIKYHKELLSIQNRVGGERQGGRGGGGKAIGESRSARRVGEARGFFPAAPRHPITQNMKTYKYFKRLLRWERAGSAGRKGMMWKFQGEGQKESALLVPFHAIDRRQEAK